MLIVDGVGAQCHMHPIYSSTETLCRRSMMPAHAIGLWRKGTAKTSSVPNDPTMSQRCSKGVRTCTVSMCAAGEWQPDPRLPALGWRGVFSGTAASEAGASAGADAYVRWRALHGVAEGSVEMPTGTSASCAHA